MDIEVNNKKYELIKNYKEAFDKEEFLSKCTDYFYDYDYIVGDIAYGKLRLKGFYIHQILERLIPRIIMLTIQRFLLSLTEQKLG